MANKVIPPYHDDVSCRYGAPMGRTQAQNGTLTGKLYLRRVEMYDGDYDKGGAYWGGGRGTQPLWCAWNDDGAMYVRASSRAEAKKLVQRSHKEATFFA